MTDLRDLCARMADELDHYRQLLMDDRSEVHALATEARAVLARWGQLNHFANHHDQTTTGEQQ